MMRISGISLALLLGLGAAFASPVASADTRVNLGLSFSDGDLDGFSVGIGDYYGYDRPYIDRLYRHYHIPYDEMPVVFYFADVLGMDPLVIVRLRLDGWGWYDIGRRYRLPPSIYYYPVAARCRGWGPIAPFYRYPERDWGRIRLSDRDVVELVNLRYLSHRYGYAPDRIIDWRRGGRDFVRIDRDVWRERGPGHGRFQPPDWRHGDRDRDRWESRPERFEPPRWSERDTHRDRGWQNDHPGHRDEPGRWQPHPSWEDRGQAWHQRPDDERERQRNDDRHRDARGQRPGDFRPAFAERRDDGRDRRSPEHPYQDHRETGQRGNAAHVGPAASGRDPGSNRDSSRPAFQDESHGRGGRGGERQVADRGGRRLPE